MGKEIIVCANEMSVTVSVSVSVCVCECVSVWVCEWECVCVCVLVSIVSVPLQKWESLWWHLRIFELVWNHVEKVYLRPEREWQRERERERERERGREGESVWDRERGLCGSVWVCGVLLVFNNNNSNKNK